MNYENIKSIILTILVLTSLVLTWSLWTYQPAFDYISSEKLLQDVEISDKQEIQDLIKPANMLFHYDGVHYGTTDLQEINRFMKEMGKWSLSDIQQISSSEFTTIMHGKGRMEIVFPDEIPLQTFRYSVGFSESEIPNVTIDRIVINVENQADKLFPTIYLVNYNDRRIYSAKVNNMSLTFINQSFYKNAVNYSVYKVIKATDDRFIYVPEDAIEMNRMNFISDFYNPEEFKDALFNDPSIVTKDQISMGEVYTDSSSLMRIDRTYSFLEYGNPVNADLGNSADFNVIEQSIDFVNEHSGWTVNENSGWETTYRYSKWGRTPQEQSASFRLHVNGNPVFHSDGLAEIRQVWRNNEVYRYLRPIFELKIRIDQQKVTLPPVSEVEFELNELNIDYEKLQDVRVGYELKRDVTNKEVYILDPAWFYKYNDSWNEVVFTKKDELGGM